MKNLVIIPFFGRQAGSFFSDLVRYEACNSYQKNTLERHILENQCDHSSDCQERNGNGTEKELFQFLGTEEWNAVLFERNGKVSENFQKIWYRYRYFMVYFLSLLAIFSVCYGPILTWGILFCFYCHSKKLTDNFPRFVGLWELQHLRICNIKVSDRMILKKVSDALFFPCIGIGMRY